MIATIFAPITGRGGAVTVVRLAGPAALAIAGRLTKPPPARRASLRVLRDGQGQVLDRAVVTVFPEPASFTGDDCVEFSLHGGPAVLAAVSDVLVALGARPAEPGEFSRRAFLNGRLDLLAAEAMADLIAAETEAQRRLAVEGADALQIAAAGWREKLRQLMAQQEAMIDFPDEDLPPEVEGRLRTGIAALRDEIETILRGAPAASRLREGLAFVILGAPNAGKSTLMNLLAGEDVAIVSETPGTTRDVLGVRIDLGGVPVRLSDTAGIRATADAVEAEGVMRAKAKAKAADLIIGVAAAPAPVFPETPAGTEVLHIITKSDLFDVVPMGFLAVSARNGAGLDMLRDTLTRIAMRMTDRQAAPALARPRQVACLRDTAAALSRAQMAADPELRAEDLREAANALARLTGVLGVEEILDAVFGGFCIGK